MPVYSSMRLEEVVMKRSLLLAALFWLPVGSARGAGTQRTPGAHAVGDRQAGRPRPRLSGPLSLDQAVATALEESPVIRGAVAEVEAALARLDQARAARRPQLSANTFGSVGNSPN